MDIKYLFTREGWSDDIFTGEGETIKILLLVSLGLNKRKGNILRFPLSLLDVKYIISFL